MQEKTSQFSGRPKTVWVKDLAGFKERKIYERFMVREVYLAVPDRNGGWRVVFEVGDKTGRVQLNVWRVPQVELKRLLTHFSKNSVFAIEATARERDGAMALHLTFPRAGGKLPWQCAATDFFPEDF